MSFNIGSVSDRIRLAICFVNSIKPINILLKFNEDGEIFCSFRVFFVVRFNKNYNIDRVRKINSVRFYALIAIVVSIADWKSVSPSECRETVRKCKICRIPICVTNFAFTFVAVRFGRVPKREKAKILAEMHKANAQSQVNNLSAVLDDEERLISTIIAAHMETCEFTRDKITPLLQHYRQFGYPRSSSNVVNFLNHFLLSFCRVNNIFLVFFFFGQGLSTKSDHASRR